MSIQTQQVLTPKMISQLQELIQVNIDSRDGFRHASEVTDDLTLQCAFEQIAIDRDAQADELARFVAWSGEYPRREGSVAAAVHRAWMTVRESLSTDDRLAVLSEAERGEDSIKAAYEKARESFADTAVSEVLLRQYSAVKFSHDRIRDLRDSCTG